MTITYERRENHEAQNYTEIILVFSHKENDLL